MRRNVLIAGIILVIMSWMLSSIHLLGLDSVQFLNFIEEPLIEVIGFVGFILFFIGLSVAITGAIMESKIPLQQQQSLKTERVNVTCSRCGKKFMYDMNINAPTRVFCPFCGSGGTI